MRLARAAILRMGGMERANTYTKYHLALFGQLPWQEVPAIPPEMMFLPRVSPFTVYDMSAWSRTIFVPLSILYAHKPVCALPASRGVAELFAAAPSRTRPPRSPLSLKTLFFAVDKMLKATEKAPGAVWPDEQPSPGPAAG